MRTDQHTQGPWSLRRNQAGEEYGAVLGHDGQLVATTGYRVHPLSNEDDANATLIAAAPELLEALQGLLAECNRHGCFENVSFEFPTVKPFFDAARSAIAKATGR